MAQDQRSAIRSAIAALNWMVLLLAVVVLAFSVAVFCIVDMTLHQGVIQALLISVIPNISASVFIYIALYFSISRLDDLRQEAWRQELVEEITGRIGERDAASAADGAVIKSGNSALAYRHVRPDQRIIIQRFLEATYLLVAALTGNRELRMHCHVADQQKSLLYPVSIVSKHINDDYESAIPYEGTGSAYFVIAEAMRERRIVAANLPEDHRKNYPGELKVTILATIQCVIAVPILTYQPNGEGSTAIGTISIDCESATCEELGVVDSHGVVAAEMNDILKSCSRAVHQVLTM